jgi:hypothetical protein
VKRKASALWKGSLRDGKVQSRRTAASFASFFVEGKVRIPKSFRQKDAAN